MAKPNLKPPVERDEPVSSYRLELGTRISSVADQLGRRTEAAEEAGVSTDQLQNYITGKAKPPFEVMARLARKAGVSLDWLARGEGVSQFVAPSSDSYPPAVPEGFVNIPTLDVRAGAGGGQLMQGAAMLSGPVSFKESWIKQRLRVDPRDLVVIEGQGDSMAPTIVDGGLLLCWTAHQRVRDSAIYAFVMDGELLVKRLQRIPGGRLRIKSDNPAYDDLDLDPETADQLQVVGQIIWKGGPA